MCEKMERGYPIRIVKGNYFGIAQPLNQITWESSTRQVTDFVPGLGDRISVCLVGEHSKYDVANITIEGNRLNYDCNGILKTGHYGVEVKVVQADGKRLRSYQDNRIQIVNTNEEAGIRGDDEFDVDSYELDGAVMLLLKGPKGDKGDRGNDGTVSFDELTDTQRAMLKGDRGDPGRNGLSAYEVALDNGFEGNMREWLNSLKGEQGDKGDTGPQGEQGEKGDTVIIGNEQTYTLYGTMGENSDGAMTQLAVSRLFSHFVTPSDVAKMPDPDEV